MFSFNLIPFNGAFTAETYFNVMIESQTGISARLSIDMPVAIVFESTSEMTSSMLREYTLDSTVIETAAELITQLIRERLLHTSHVDSATSFDVTVTHSHVDEIRFLGDFRPGDKLVIDTRKMTVTLNGQNAIHLLDGDFFELVLGTNKITYSDGEGARNILTRITHRDKFLY